MEVAENSRLNINGVEKNIHRSEREATSALPQEGG